MRHWLILIPYFLVGTITVTAFLVVVCRLIRLNLSADGLVRTAVLCTLLLLIGPLWVGWVTLAFFTLKGVFALMALSFILAGLDAALRKKLPLAVDRDMKEHA